MPGLRNPLRLYLGKKYFTVRRHFKWFRHKKQFSKSFASAPLPFNIFSHQSLLKRSLQNELFSLQENKINNLNIAIKKLSGLIIKPGEIFSFWYLVGKPSAAKGYLSGMVLKNGKITEEVGGGLCQLTNLIYWMTLHSPLTIIERWRHSHDVFPDVSRTQPFGSGATVAYNYIDLQIKNNTQQTFQLNLSLSSTHLHGTWFSDKENPYFYQIEERNHEITHEFWGGYMRHNEIYKLTFDANTKNKMKEEKVAENHCVMMYDPLLKSGV